MKIGSEAVQALFLSRPPPPTKCQVSIPDSEHDRRNDETGFRGPFLCIVLTFSFATGTHLLPPNLLKLFAPRPPVPYARPLGRDPDRVSSKNVSGVAYILEQLKDEVVAAGAAALAPQNEDMEEGEEPVYTHAEETKRQLLREEKKKNKQDLFKIAKETCQLLASLFLGAL